MPTQPPISESGRAVRSGRAVTVDPGDQPVLVTESGLHLPRLGLGTWQLSGSACQRAVEQALGVGFRHIDTAQSYGNEAEVGAALTASGIDRDEVFVTTKIADDAHEPDDLRRSIDESLERLGVDSIDLVLVHWPVAWDRMAATLATLAIVQGGGLCRHIGVSNFTAAQLDETIDMAPIEVLQAECHAYLPQDDLRRRCRDLDLAFVAYSPLAKGDLVGDPTIEAIAEARSVSSAEVALAWLLAQPGVAAIPRTSDPDHLASDFAARELRLDDDEMERIATIATGERRIDPEHAPWR